jgi:hypothetical protein
MQGSVEDPVDSEPVDSGQGSVVVEAPAVVAAVAGAIVGAAVGAADSSLSPPHPVMIAASAATEMATNRSLARTSSPREVRRLLF